MNKQEKYLQSSYPGLATIGIPDSKSLQIIREGAYSYYAWHTPAMILQMTNRTVSPDEIESVGSIFSPMECLNIASRARREAYDKWSSPASPMMHYHSGFELCYILSGSMHQIAGDQDYYYPAGGACFMAPYTLHSEMHSSDFVALFIALSPEFMEKLIEFCSDDLIFDSEKQILDNPILNFAKEHLQEASISGKPFLDFVPKIKEPEQKEMIHRILDRLIRIFLDQKPGSTSAMYTELQALLGVLTDEKYYDFDAVSSGSKSSSLLFSRVDQLLNEYHGRISNSELSRILNYNGNYLCRVIKKYTSMSLFDYSMTFTMQYAAELLLNSRLTIQEIMDQLRFSNRTHFNVLFRKAYGMSPSEYRKSGKLRSL